MLQTIIYNLAQGLPISYMQHFVTIVDGLMAFYDLDS